jgi:hypothetical protein
MIGSMKRIKWALMVVSIHSILQTLVCLTTCGAMVVCSQICTTRSMLNVRFRERTFGLHVQTQ